MACFPHTSGTFSIGGYLPLNVHSHSEPLAIKVSNKWFPLDGDKLHNYFWSLTHEDNTRRECVPAWREQYIQRCFDVMAVWYALSKEASKTYDALQSQKSDHTFNIMSLFEMVLDAFTSLGDAFHIQRGPLDDFSRQYYAATVREVEALEEVAPVTAAFPISIPVPVKGFLDLPPELHFQIVSYLPLHDLISLSMVCRAIRPQCVVSIFRDPLSVLGELSTGSFDYKIYRRFQSMLEARPHLLHHVRRYTGYYNFLPLDPITSSGRYNEMRLAKGVDIRSPLASQLSYLRWAELNLWNLEYWRQDPDKAIHHALQLAQKCWPDLQSLELKIYQECQSISPIADHNTSELAGDCGKVGCFCGPPNWRLRQLSITAHAYRDLLGIQLVTLPPVPLSSLLQGCAATLTRLKLDLPAAAFGDIRSIPDLFCLSYLSLPSNLSAPDIDIFLPHCPNLSSLEFGPWDWSEAILDTRLDLFGCSNLEILHLHRTPYTISRLPESMRTVNAEMHSLLPLKLEVHNPVQASVFALRLTLELDTRSRTIGALLDLLAPLSKEYPKLSLLELKMQGFYHGTDDQLVRIAKCASDQFPLLQTLILNWREFENNPRRIDFPAADSGQEERERRIVQWMFSECGSLNVVALTGVPPLVQDNPYVHPRMVWAKTVDEEGNVNAVRTGRTAIRWVDETNVL
ncbi:hypothetical protein E1B28_006547 [Marasmius oreades]|nr:uncharacterized protein E1B28_006547 [Marasmius oreades]KAG7095853.1 hypothetical protein E1B28_006547 [Marasmius oreades]